MVSPLLVLLTSRPPKERDGHGADGLTVLDGHAADYYPAVVETKESCDISSHVLTNRVKEANKEQPHIQCLASIQVDGRIADYLGRLMDMLIQTVVAKGTNNGDLLSSCQLVG
jgi:hypothetical protein